MNVIHSIKLSVKFLFQVFSVILALWACLDQALDPYFTYLSIMLSFLSLYESVPFVISQILHDIGASKYARYLDKMNTILNIVNIHVFFPLGVIVHGLLKLLRRCCIVYVIWSVVLSILCFMISDSFAAQYQQFFVSNSLYNVSLRESKTSPLNKSHLLKNSICINERQLDISALLNDNDIIYRKNKSPYCEITDVDNTTLQDLRVHVKSPGEFAKLYCTIGILNASILFGLKLEWKKDNRIIHADNQTIKITTDLSDGFLKSFLTIPFIKEENYGIYTCQIKRNIQSDEHYLYGSKSIPLRQNTLTYTNLFSRQILKQYSGIQDVIFVPVGNKLQMVWYPLSFGIDSENITQTYFINGEETTVLKQKRDGCHGCSPLTSLFSVCGYLRNWFVVYMRCSLWDVVVNNPGYTTTCFATCADTSVYGIHTIAYRRLVYDKVKKAIINKTVQHPDTVIVLPDNPYFNQMDNSSKFEKVNRVMRHMMLGDIKKEMFQDKSDIESLIHRYYAEMITFFITSLALYLFFIDRNKLWSICPFTLECIQTPYSYNCYIFCCDEDSDVVSSQLYNKLLDENVNAGIILNNCELNNPGRYNFEITPDIIKNSLALIFFITPSYLADAYCKNYHLIYVMENIKMENILATKVLFIMVDDVVLENDIDLNTLNVPKLKWNTSNSYFAYTAVRKWLPVEVCRFPEWSFMKGFALVKIGNVV